MSIANVYLLATSNSYTFCKSIHPAGWGPDNSDERVDFRASFKEKDHRTFGNGILKWFIVVFPVIWPSMNQRPLENPECISALRGWFSHNADGVRARMYDGISHIIVLWM